MRVMVAMSGGVDSSVAAALVARAGHHVVGVTMKLWGGDSDTGCCSVSDVDDARRVADRLGIDHHVFNFGDEFDRHVVAPYVAAHAEGRTPNPCVECNRHLKFDVLLARAQALGFDRVATGHHARIVAGADGRPRLARGADRAKDQSYVLYPLAGAALGAVDLPIGGMTKAEVRAVAADLGLRTATKPDSQDVCFIQRAEGRRAFLGSRIPLHPATVVDTSGREVGRVDAVELVTIGQRKGLDLAGGTGRRFVVDVIADAGDGGGTGSPTVVVGDDADLLRPVVDLRELVWAHDPVGGALLAQTSAHGDAGPGRAELLADGGVRWTWAEPRRRVAPGQSVVLYDGDTVVGGGIAV